MLSFVVSLVDCSCLPRSDNLCEGDRESCQRGEGVKTEARGDKCFKFGESLVT
jgi:hypothetical protein